MPEEQIHSHFSQINSVIDCSIIIPVFNESAHIDACAAQLKSLIVASQYSIEVIFIDGGSTDNTCHRIADHGFRVLSSDKGRAQQMNAGAEFSRGNILAFYHVDTQVYPTLVDDIVRAAKQGVDWGRFNVHIEGDHWMFKVIAKMMNWRSKLTRVATGDQLIWVSKQVFRDINGYRVMPLMEDVDLSKRLRKQHRMYAHSTSIITSGRRWMKYGVWKTILLMWSLRFDYWRGVDVQLLAKRYR